MKRFDPPLPPDSPPGRLPYAAGDWAEVIEQLAAALDHNGFPAWSPAADVPFPARVVAPALWWLPTDGGGL